jgi:Fe-S oxidoreductase
MKVTYHDPCHLGRLGEDYEPWDGEWKEVVGHMLISDPPKPLRTGEQGVYQPPRDILNNIPGLEVTEMERNKTSAWCCGAGGGALEAFPDFAYRTAMERIEEARATGAQALVTSCPWCERNLKDAIRRSGENFNVYDIIELLRRAR